MDDIAEMEESLAYLKDAEHTLLTAGERGALTIHNTGQWADELRRCRAMIARQERAIVAARLAEEIQARTAGREG